MKVPAGTQSGQSFKLRGKGVVHVNGRERGDLYATAARRSAEPPEHRATPEAGGIRALCGEDNTPLHRSFFERAKEFFR